MQSHVSLIQQNLEILAQGLQVLNRLSDTEYPEIRHPFSQYGIGSHLRHCLDFYLAFLNGVEIGWIDYDERRQNREIETGRQAAIACLQWVMHKLESLSGLQDQALLMVRLEDTAGEHEPRAWSRSSVLRELQSLISHTVHHFALMAVMLQLNGLATPPEFGVAPSTLKRWRSVELCAR
ncbi:MAG: DinB family protein [Acidobacteriota bacterium]